MGNFAKCIVQLLDHEGGYTDDQRDNGGATKYGITMATLEAHRCAPVTKNDVRGLSLLEAEEIYRQNYWNRCKCDLLPSGVDYVVFDAAVNSGPLNAIKWLQKAVDVVADGIIGAKTLAAVKAHRVDDIVQRFQHNRIDLLLRHEDFPAFGRGWMRRVSDVSLVAGLMIE